MSVLSLNDFSAGASRLSAAQLTPAHKRSVEKNLAKILGDSPFRDQSLQLQLEPSGATFFKEGKEISLPPTRELKRIKNTVRYYQRLGLLDRNVETPSDASARAQEMKKTVEIIRERSVPGTNGSILAGMRLADDTLSLTRNVLFAIHLPSFGPKNEIANHLGYYAGLFWSFFALRELDNGLTEHKRSIDIKDKEGAERAKSRIFSGSIISLASASYLTGKICDTYASASIANPILGLSSVLFGAGSFLAAGTSVCGLVRCNRFKNRLFEYLNHPGLPQVQRLKGAIHFLKDTISVTAEERNEIRAYIEKKHPRWPVERKERLYLQKVSDLSETKVKYLKRRTSSQSLSLIASQIDEILNKLNDPKRVQEGVRDASILIQKIQTANQIKTTLYALGAIAATISAIATVVLNFFASGAVPFVMYGISGAIYLMMTIYILGGEAIGYLKNRQLDKKNSSGILTSCPLSS